jgi:hypothetical protein
MRLTLTEMARFPGASRGGRSQHLSYLVDVWGLAARSRRVRSSWGEAFGDERG